MADGKPMAVRDRPIAADVQPMMSGGLPAASSMANRLTPPGAVVGSPTAAASPPCNTWHTYYNLLKVNVSMCRYPSILLVSLLPALFLLNRILRTRILRGRGRGTGQRSNRAKTKGPSRSTCTHQSAPIRPQAHGFPNETASFPI